MYLDGTHLLGYILACALYQPLAQIGGELCLRIGGDVDAAAERSAHIGGYLTDCVHFHRVRDEDSFLSVRVVNGKLNRNDRPLMFQRSDCYAETFTLNPCRSDKDGIAWDDFLRNRHRLQKPQPDSLPVRHALCPIDTCRYGVLVRYRTASHCRVETHVALL